MSFLIFVYRHQDIIRRKSEINLKLSRLLSRLRDLQSYAASIADGNMTMQDMLQVAPSQFGRMMAYNVFSQQVAQGKANMNFNAMRSSGILQQQEAQQQMLGTDPQTQKQRQYYEQSIFNNLFENERKVAAEKESKLLNKQETEIEQQKAALEDQLKMLDSEEQTVTKAEDEGAKKSAPQYVA